MFKELFKMMFATKTFKATMLITLIVAGFAIYTKFQTDTVQVKVTDKERIVLNTSEGVESKYMIYTNKTTYELTDSLIAFNFDVSDDYGQIEQSKCYEFYVRGIRVGFLSMYQNIEEIKEIPCEGI